ncbi:hypothetical protein CsSME_00012923 [Camellia sinensis var. sinensis]
MRGIRSQKWSEDSASSSSSSITAIREVRIFTSLADKGRVSSKSESGLGEAAWPGATVQRTSTTAGSYTTWTNKSFHFRRYSRKKESSFKSKISGTS